MQVAYFLNPQNFNPTGQADFTAQGRSPDIGEIIFFKLNDLVTKYKVEGKFNMLIAGYTGAQIMVSVDCVLLIPTS
jgi:hypothetical protein